jgi:peptide/nickel transport system substrate-binding protein
MRELSSILLAAALLLAGCHSGRNGGPIEVSVIGERANAPAVAAAIDGATQSGLVRLDREGQIIPGAAARWAILDDGLDYIFRIDDGAGLPAATIARRLREALRRHRHDPDFAALAAVESIEAVTATVVEMRLSAPQPDVLPLLARPEFSADFPTPLRRPQTKAANALLEAVPSADEAPYPVMLRTERVGRAVARFHAGEALLVLGGTFADLPVAHVIQPPRKALRFDPATGLFGFAIVNQQLSSPLRNALSLAVDRDRIVTAVGAPGQVKATTIAGSALEPPLPQRRAAARALLAGQTALVRVAMPRGPGARLLFALAAQDWRDVGIETQMVPLDAPADLALIDRVAPAGTLATLACALSTGCDPRDRLALINPPFIPLAAPVRWSLVAPSLDLFTENALAAHPLDQLRSRR